MCVCVCVCVRACVCVCVCVCVFVFVAGRLAVSEPCYRQRASLWAAWALFSLVLSVWFPSKWRHFSVPFQLKHDELIVPECFARQRSDEMVTPTKRTWSLDVMVSSQSRSGGPLLPSKVEPYLEPAQRSFVLSAFNLSLFAAIQHEEKLTATI